MEDRITDESTVQAQKRSALSRAAHIVVNVLFYCLLALMLLLVFFLVQGRLTGEPPRVFGHQLYLVMSGSMSPAIEVGSVVAVKPVPPETISAGDIISFRGAEDRMLTTHRAVAVNSDNGLSFITKGDANEAADRNPVAAENVAGKVALAVPYAGYVLNFAGTRPGLLSMVLIPGALIIAFEVRNLFACARQIDREKALAEEADTADTGPGK